MLYTSFCLLGVRRKILISNFVRECHQPPKVNGSVIKSYHSFRKYVLSKYLEYVKNYENALEKRFPGAWRIYRVFKIGITDFYQDMKSFLVVARKVNGAKGDLHCLSRQELELYFKMPRDMYHIAPVLLVSALPLVNYVVFPLAYLFPKQLLTSHFWTLQQRTQFAVADQKAKLHHYKPVFRCLQEKLNSLDHHPLHSAWNMCIAMLGSGLHPSHQNIVACVPIFTGTPYSLRHLSSKHVRGLAKMHDIHAWWFKRRKLAERARQIRLIDLAIDREGGVKTLSHDEVRTACFLRGLNPTYMNSEDASFWLTSWIELSKSLPPDSPSLLLHSPILLAYNHPSNWILIH